MSVYICDTNCLVGPWPARTPAYETVEGLLTEMERLGIARSLVAHTTARTYDPRYGNRRLMQEIAGHDELWPCWVLLPPSCGEMGSLDELLAQMAQAKVRAVRLYPRDHTFSLAEWQCGELLRVLESRHYPVLLGLDQTDWDQVSRLCRTYPDLPWIMVGVNYRQLRPLFALLQQHDNLYVELSTFAPYLGVEEVVSRFGSGRLLFGSGLPLEDPGGPLARLTYAAIPESAREDIAHRNLERLLACAGKGAERCQTD